MSEWHNEKLRLLAKRSNANQMSPEDAFVQGFIMGRKYEREFNSQLHNSILKEMHEKSDYKFDDNNYWDNEIKRLDEENMDLKSKYVWSNDE